MNDILSDTGFTSHAIAAFGGAVACLITMAVLGDVTKPPPRYPAPEPVALANPPAYTPPGMRLGFEETLQQKPEPWSATGSPVAVVLYGHKRDGTPVSIQVDDDGHVMCAP